MAVDLMSVLLDGLLAAAPAAPPLPLPPSRATDQQLGQDANAWRALLVRYLEVQLAPRYRALPDLVVRGVPGAAPRRWDLTPQLQQVMRAASTVPGWVEPQTHSLPNSQIERYDFKLRGLQGTADIAGGFALLGTYLSSQSLPPTAIASRAAARTALDSLVAFNAFLIRFGACIAAASAARVSLAEALALYRTEGDLVAPLSADHLDEGWPFLAHESMKGIHLTEYAPIVMPTMKRGLWSFPLDPPLPPALPPEPEKAAFGLLVKMFALGHWMVIIGGLDLLFIRIKGVTQNAIAEAQAKGAAFDVNEMFELYADMVTGFMSENRGYLGLPSGLRDQEAAFRAVFDDLQVRWPATKAGRVVVVPKHPERLVTFVLSEALLFFQLEKDQGEGPFVAPPDRLKYLAYNLQHKRSHVALEDDRFAHLLVSAAARAQADGRATFAALRAKLEPLNLVRDLPNEPKKDPSLHVAEFNKLTGFLSSAADFDLLADYILRAPLGPWYSFIENRANVARYHKLLAYYTALLA